MLKKSRIYIWYIFRLAVLWFFVLIRLPKTVQLLVLWPFCTALVRCPPKCGNTSNLLSDREGSCDSTGVIERQFLSFFFSGLGTGLHQPIFATSTTIARIMLLASVTHLVVLSELASFSLISFPVSRPQLSLTISSRANMMQSLAWHLPWGPACPATNSLAIQRLPDRPLYSPASEGKRRDQLQGFGFSLALSILCFFILSNILLMLCANGQDLRLSFLSQILFNEIHDTF